MEGKHIKNDNFHPIIQFTKGQTLLTKSNNTARLSLIRILLLQYNCQHLEIICLPKDIAATIVGLFPKQRRKLDNYRIMYNIIGPVSINLCQYCRDATVFRHTFPIASFVYTRKRDGSQMEKVPELHNHLSTVGAELANTAEPCAY